MKPNISKLPIIGETYNTFDDGKIKESRLYKVEIEDIIPFKDINKETLDIWVTEVKNCYWLYNKETDYFIKGILSNKEQVIYCRTKDNGWFDLGEWGGSLDVDGKLFTLLKETERIRNES